MTHSMTMSENNILHAAILGEITEEVASAMLQDAKEFLDEATEPVSVLVDTRKAGKISSSARRIFADLGRDPRGRKIAVLGLDRYQRVMASFINRATGRDNIRFFDSEEQALVWLVDEG